jgi:adenylate cyclase
MAIEIERKFLVSSDAWRPAVTHSERMAQAYLGGTHCSTRVRIGETDGERRAFLNIKSKTKGSTRLEFEYAIPVSDAEDLMRNLSDGAAIIKTRYYVPHDDVLFEVDVFEGENAGLVIAEVELTHSEQSVARPFWLGSEVTDDVRYYNLSLVERPYSRWAVKE